MSCIYHSAWWEGPYNMFFVYLYLLIQSNWLGINFILNNEGKKKMVWMKNLFPGSTLWYFTPVNMNHQGPPPTGIHRGFWHLTISYVNVSTPICTFYVRIPSSSYPGRWRFTLTGVLLCNTMQNGCMPLW